MYWDQNRGWILLPLFPDSLLELMVSGLLLHTRWNLLNIFAWISYENLRAENFKFNPKIPSVVDLNGPIFFPRLISLDF